MDGPAAEAEFLRTYPALHAHMKAHEGRLRKRTDQGEFWWELRSCAYYQDFERPKIAYQEIQFHPAYALDDRGYYANNKVFFIPGRDLWLLGVLNSPLMWWHNWRYLSHMKDEALNPAGAKMIGLPIPEATPSARAEAEELVDANVEATRTSQQAIRDLLMWLRTEHGIDKPGRSLADPAGVTTDAFADEVRKRRPRAMGKPSPAELRQVREVHEATRLPLLRHRHAIAVAERRLSELVNAAYGLTAQDVDLIRRTAPPRMPQGLAPAPGGRAT